MRDIIQYIHNLIDSPEKEAFKREVCAKLKENDLNLNEVTRFLDKEVKVKELIGLVKQFITWVFSLGGLMILSTLLSPFMT